MQYIMPLILTSYKATANYIYSRILSTTYREVYKNAAKMAIIALDENITSIEMMKARIHSLKEEARHLYPPSLFSSKQDHIKYHCMAIDHAMEIIYKLDMRFLKGGSDSEPRNYKNRELYIYDNQDIFSTNGES